MINEGAGRLKKFRISHTKPQPTGPGSLNLPSGARAPETVTAEAVGAPPPVSPEGVMRAIAEHSAGEHGSEVFEPIRDHYAAIAEAVIRRDDIPLTRRNVIQRYFEALRTHEGP